MCFRLAEGRAYPSLMLDLSPEIKSFAREHDSEIRERCLADFKRELQEMSFAEMSSKYDAGAAEHGLMTQFKLLVTRWLFQRSGETKDFYWYTAIVMYREWFVSMPKEEQSD